MKRVSPRERHREGITMDAVYDHSRAKLSIKRSKVKSSRKAEFLSVSPMKDSPKPTPGDVEQLVSNARGKTSRPNCKHQSEAASQDQPTTTAETKSLDKAKQKLQLFVRGALLPETLCLQLDPETLVSSLKESIKSKSGIQPQDQHLFTGRNFMLCDLLSLADHGIQQDQNIEMRAGGLLGGAPENEQLGTIYFQKLSRKLGTDWKALAIELGFELSQVKVFEEDNKDNTTQQGLKMLDKWYKKQENPEEAPQTLKDALRSKEVGRADLALKVPGVSGEHFDVEECAEELTAHYQQTLKVTTHPTKRGTAVEIGRLYVSQQLLEETNLATPSCSSEFKIHPAATIKLGHLKAKSQRSTSGSSVSKAEKETGFLFQNVPLDSYEDMLALKTNRILATAEAGYGKTTLFKKIVYDWVDMRTNGTQQKSRPQPGSKFGLKDYKLVFLIEVNRMGRNFDIVDAIFSQILTESKFKKEDLVKYIRNNQKTVLILLDGADEISLQRLTQTEQSKDKINLNDVLSFRSLKSCKTVVASRQKTANELLNMHEHFTKVHVAGFNEKDREKYVRKYLVNFSEQSQNSFLEKVNTSNTLRSLGEIPLFLWLMCFTWAGKKTLPDQITNLFSQNIEHLFEHKDRKEKGSQADNFACEAKTYISTLGRVALEGLLDPNGQKLYFKASEIGSEDLEIFEKGCTLGLLSKTETLDGLTSVTLFSFLHKTFQEYCAAVYLDGLSRSNKKAFNDNLSCILGGDVESVEFVLRFCCGLNVNTAQTIIKEIDGLLKQDKTKEPLQRILTLLLFEAQSESLIEETVETGKIQFTFEIQGEDLVAAHYLVQVGSKRKALGINSVKAKCDSLEHLRLLKDIVANIECNTSLILNLANVHWDNFADASRGMVKHMKRLDVRTADWNILKLFDMLSYKRSEISTLVVRNTISFEVLSEQIAEPGPVSNLTVLALADAGMKSKDIESLFLLLSSAGSIQTVLLKDNNLHGLQDVKIKPVPSLNELQLHECNLTKNDIGPLFSLLATAASVKSVVLKGNDLRGLQPNSISPVPSLRELYLDECNLTKCDIEPIFALLSAAGGIQTVILIENDLQRLQPVQIQPMPSLRELHLYGCNLSYSEIEALFSLLEASGSVKTVFLKENNFRGLEPVKIRPVPSLSDLQLQECGLTNCDIEPLFSLIAAAGSIETVSLSGSNFRGFQVAKCTRVSSLSTLQLHECNLTTSDIKPLFSFLEAVTNIKKVILSGSNLHELQPAEITPVPSLSELQLRECSLKSSDTEPLFSLLEAAKTIQTVVLYGNDLHGLESVKINPVPSLCEVQLQECSLTSCDIGPLFSLLAAAGSVKTVLLKGNNLHGLQPVGITQVPSLRNLQLQECSLTTSDIEPLFSLLAAAGSIEEVALSGGDFNGMQPGKIGPIPGLCELELHECNLKNTDIETLFSLLAALGSIRKLVLSGNNLQGLQHAQVHSVPLLSELHLYDCSLTNDDVEPLFSLLPAAGSVQVVLHGNDLRGLQSVHAASVPSLNDLQLQECNLAVSDIEPLFSLLAALGRVVKVGLSGTNLHGLQPMAIRRVPLLCELQLQECCLNTSDLGPLFSVLAAVGNVMKAVLIGCDFGGLQHIEITHVPNSLCELHLYKCNLTKCDVQPLLSLLVTVGTVRRVILKDNNLQGLQPVEFTPVSSLRELHLFECCLTTTDIEPLFSLIEAAGGITTLVLRGNNLRNLQPVQLPRVPSLFVMQLQNCELGGSDVQPLFSLVRAAGSVQTVVLKENNLHGLQSVKIEPVPSLGSVHLHDSCLTNVDIKPLFSLLAAAGSIETVVLKGNNFSCLQPAQITPVSSLRELHLYECRLANTDVGPLFSLLASSGGIKTVLLRGNNLHGLQSANIKSVPSLCEMEFHKCSLTSSDVEPLFSLLAAAGSIKEVVLQGNNLHGLNPLHIASVPSLCELQLGECRLTKSDAAPFFSLLAQAGNVTKVVLSGNDLHGLPPVKITQSLARDNQPENRSSPDSGVLFSFLSLFLSFLCYLLFSLFAAATNIGKGAQSAINYYWHGVQPVKIDPVPSLRELHMYECHLATSDIEPLFSLLAAAGDINKVVLDRNNLHDMQPVAISPVPSLGELHLSECSLAHSDIEPLLSILASACSLHTLVLNANRLHGLSEMNVAPIPSLSRLFMDGCGLDNGDIEAVFHLLSSLGHVQMVNLRYNHFSGRVTGSLAPVPSLLSMSLGDGGLTSVRHAREIDFGERRCFKLPTFKNNSLK